MLDFCIIGSGISGSTIAHYLKKKYSINVHDKARGVGGRSSFKRYKGKIGFDHGLQYLSPRSKEFKSFTNKLIKKKVLKYWRGNHKFLNEKVKRDKKHIKLIGVKGNNDISKFLLKNISCNFQSELSEIKRQKNYCFNVVHLRKILVAESKGSSRFFNNKVLSNFDFGHFLKKSI